MKSLISDLDCWGGSWSASRDGKRGWVLFNALEQSFVRLPDGESVAGDQEYSAEDSEQSGLGVLEGGHAQPIYTQ